MNQEKIGKFIAKKRKDRKLTQEQFAKRVIIYNQEKGKEIPISTFKI